MPAAADPRLVQLLRGASRILVFTGAGVSTPSGIPDYRGPAGQWKARQPVDFKDFLRREEARIEYWEAKLATWEAFRDAAPNRTHQAIVALERAGKLECLVTQNVDGLHAKAGTSRARLVEIHGNGLDVECLSCGERSDPEPHLARFRSAGRSPRCPCGGLLKPATISFGQPLRQGDLERAFAAAFCADLVVALGSTLLVTPAADIPLAAASRGVPYAVVNDGITAHDGLRQVSLRIEGRVESVLPPAVAEALGP
jgi:NAD-dependent deacetylase